MFLKHRDLMAWILILSASVSVVFGRLLLADGTDSGESFAFTSVIAKTTFDPDDPPAETQSVKTDIPQPTPESNVFGGVLNAVAAVSAIAAVFVLRQKAPLFGPDGAMVLTGAAILCLHFRSNTDTTTFVLLGILAFAGLLAAVRELWGWIFAKLRLEWCLVNRAISRVERPQFALALLFIWTLAAAGLVAAAVLISVLLQPGLLYPAVCTAANAVFPVLCLWRYGLDLDHFKLQLKSYERGLPIIVREGSFAAAERQLSQMQAQHEAAIRTAVTGERFKVELISNVSHDLRTPLTSILGYGELLEGEKLSDEGRERLARLNQKAGYMRQLLDDLFELTKVSSGAAEARMDEIDLIRLLEQTIGLFDDELNTAELAVRRHYDAESVPIVTDGARIHQVFANLMVNAIKYALPGTRIHLTVTSQERAVSVRMVNTASYEMDFTPEEIVQRFARGDKARTTKGSGLGLAIAKTYSESVGGQFRIAIDGDQFAAIVELPRS